MDERSDLSYMYNYNRFTFISSNEIITVKVITRAPPLLPLCFELISDLPEIH